MIKSVDGTLGTNKNPAPNSRPIHIAVILETSYSQVNVRVGCNLLIRMRNGTPNVVLVPLRTESSNLIFSTPDILLGINYGNQKGHQS